MAFGECQKGGLRDFCKPLINFYETKKLGPQHLDEKVFYT